MQYVQKVTLTNTNRNDTLVFNNLFLWLHISYITIYLSKRKYMCTCSFNNTIKLAK